MTDKKSMFYDVSGREDEIYFQHFRSDGFTQDWMHFHSKYELSLVLSGTVVSVGDGKSYRCTKPHFRLHRPYSFHTANAEAGEIYDCYVFYFSEKSFDMADYGIDISKLFRNAILVSEIDGDILKSARSCAEMLLLDTDERMRRVVLEGLLILADKSLKSRNSSLTDVYESQSLGYITDVVGYINENYSRRLTISELAKKFFVSEQKLNNDFKKRLNDTLHHYLLTVRISHAAMMISKGIPPLSAAIECGFTDESHFAKSFKSNIGITPYQFSKGATSRIEYTGDYNEKNTVI